MFARNSALTLVQETNRRDGYDFKKSVNYVDLTSYHKQIMSGDKSSHYLAIVGTYNGRVVPMIDCDSIEDYKIAFNHFSKIEIPCALIQSSPNHYWLFPDFTFNSVEAAYATIGPIPGCDQKYIKFTKNRKFFAIRGELKAIDEVPRLIYNECSETNIVCFISKLIEHFSDDRILQIANKKFKKKSHLRPSSLGGY
jgi:hypothetical protein